MSDYYFTCACAACVYFAYAAIYVLFAFAGDELPNSILGRFNYVVFQWFGFRIAKEMSDLDDDGNRHVIGYGLIFVLPTTGWDGRYYPWKNPTYYRIIKTRATTNG